MNKTLISTLLVSSLISMPIMAKDNSDTLNEPMTHETVEEIGFGTGAVVGAVIAGPLGAVITGVVGHIIAKNVNANNDIESLTTALNSEKENSQNQIALLEEELSKNQVAYQHELLALEQKSNKTSQLQAENLLMSLQFATGSSEIPAYYEPQLKALAKILKHSTNLKVDLSGYTDLQGNSELNQKLSIARAKAVQIKLVEYGIGEDRINSIGYGDSTPVVANAQQKASFYDRRVMIKLHQQPSQVAKIF